MNPINYVVQRLFGVKTRFLKTSLRNKLIIIAIVSVALWFGGSHIINTKGQQPRYQTAQAEKGTLITSISASGTVSQGSSVNITTDATGVVKDVYIKDGDIVSKGDKIADITLDINSQQKQAAAWASYLSAKNSLDAANANLYSIRSDKFSKWKTFMDLAESSGYDTEEERALPQFHIANNDWLAAEAKEKNQQAVIIQSQATVNSSWLSYIRLSSTITAPLSGKVSGLTLLPGSSIVAATNGSESSGSSQSVGTITAEEGTLQASVNLTEIDVVKVKLGQKVTLTLDAFPGKTFTGKVATVNTNGSVSSGVTAYPTTIIFDSAQDFIYPNMAVNATIITDIKDSVILVPSAAVQTANGESSVRVMRNGQVTQVEVEVGDANDTQTEITSGINEGDTVITSGASPVNEAGSPESASPFGGFGGRGGGH